MDFTNKTDEQVAEIRDASINELEKRQRLANVPTQVADTVARYITDGGNLQDIIAVLPEQ